MITSRELDDTGSVRIGRFLARFRDAKAPDPDTGDWSDWTRLLTTRLHDAEDDPRETMCIVTDRGYGTVSGSLIALPSANHPDRHPVWQFANGRPDIAPFEPVARPEAAE